MMSEARSQRLRIIEGILWELEESFRRRYGGIVQETNHKHALVIAATTLAMLDAGLGALTDSIDKLTVATEKIVEVSTHPPTVVEFNEPRGPVHFHPDDDDREELVARHELGGEG